MHGLLSLESHLQSMAEGSQSWQLQLQSLWPGITSLGVNIVGPLSLGSSGQDRGLCTTTALVTAPFNMNSISQHRHLSPGGVIVTPIVNIY